MSDPYETVKSLRLLFDKMLKASDDMDRYKRDIAILNKKLFDVEKIENAARQQIFKTMAEIGVIPGDNADRELRATGFFKELHRQYLSEISQAGSRPETADR